MQKPREFPPRGSGDSVSMSSSDVHVALPDPLGKTRSPLWLDVTLERIRIIVVSLGLLFVLYVGSYFATAFATGAGWMDVATRHRIVWTAHWPISKWAVSESRQGPRIINDANGWFFSIGWNWFHE